MDTYFIEYRNHTQWRWERYPAPGSRFSYITPSGWDIKAPFYGLTNAIQAVGEVRDIWAWVTVDHRVVDGDGHVVWCSCTEPDINEPQEESSMTEVTQALHIPREKLIERLQERKAEEEKARQDAVAANAKRRQVLLDAVEMLTTDQVANILTEYVTRDADALTKWIDEKVEGKKFVTKEVEPTPTETRLDKMIRVLQLAADNEIEVAPTDPVYPLL